MTLEIDILSHNGLFLKRFDLIFVTARTWLTHKLDPRADAYTEGFWVKDKVYLKGGAAKSRWVDPGEQVTQRGEEDG